MRKTRKIFKQFQEMIKFNQQFNSKAKGAWKKKLKKANKFPDFENENPPLKIGVIKKIKKN